MRSWWAVALILISLIVPACAGYDVIAVSDACDLVVISESQIAENMRYNVISDSDACDLVVISESQIAENMGYNTKTVYLRSYPAHESLPVWYPAVPLPLRVQLQTDNINIVLTQPASEIVMTDDSGIGWYEIGPGSSVSEEYLVDEALAGGSCNSIDRGENHYFVENIPDNKKSLRCDLNWTGSSDRDTLSLMIFPPDRVLGPFMDKDDGLVDDRILIDVSGLEGLTSGNWYYRVSGQGLSEEVKYTFVTYS